MKHLLITALALLLTLSAEAQWKAYLSYHDPEEIERAGNTLYVLASGALYSYNQTDQQLQTYDKATVLSDCNIAHIAWCQAARRLVIIYDNYNIDLLSPNSDVVNLANYKNASTTDDKTINSVDVSGTDAYLATGFGIVRLNVRDAEFRNTYQLGFRVDYTYVADGYIYAASSTRGLYRGRMTANLLNPANWERVGDYTPREKTIDPELLATVSTLDPGGPRTNSVGFLRFSNGSLYTCNGVFSDDQSYIQQLTGDNWTIYPSETIPQATGLSFHGIFALDIDPRDPAHLMAGGRNGVYEFRNGQFVAHYNDANSPIEPFSGNFKEYELITGCKFDNSGNLWVLNSQAPHEAIIEYTAGGQWVSHHQPAVMRLNDDVPNKSLGELRGIVFDSRGLMWFCNNHWNLPSLFAYQPSTDAIASFTSFYNEDGADVNPLYVRCVAEDKESNIWVGTNVGPLMLEPDQITSQSPVFNQVKVPRNDGTNYADYLLSGVDVTCMAIDRGNRKWFGTNGTGLYLIAADNITQLAHFTTDNSPLLSDNIESLAINDDTGELFIGTLNGLCSYTSRTRANDEGMTKDNVYAYPNPVRPDYNGAITITGLDEDADVKIVTSSGTLVNEGRAAGGQYRWYGTNKDGKRVASGIYMVEVATSGGSKGVVCKIAIVN